MNVTRLCPLFMAGVLSLPATAQDMLALEQADLDRLGIITSPLRMPDASTGQRFPARVISSPLEASDLTALFDGVLQHWTVETGQTVERGELLGSVRSPDVLALQHDYLDAVAAENRARLELERDQSLFEDGVIARNRLQHSELAMRNATTARRSAALLLENAGFDTQALESLAAGELPLGQYRLVAPIDGVVAHLATLPGQRIAAGDVAASLAGEQLWLSAELPAGMAAGLEKGMTLSVPGQSAMAQVHQVDRALDASAQTVGLLASFDGSVHLMPGQIVDLVLPAPDGVLVPAEAVVHNGDRATVYILTAEGIEVREVQLQPAGRDYIALEGVRANESIVVRGAAILKGIQLGLGGE